MSERDDDRHVDAHIRRINATRDRTEATIRQMIAECVRIIQSRPAQAVLPPDVPLHKRGFGVMDEDRA
jgi:hypothetical protein